MDGTAPPVAVEPTDVLTILYHERPPFYVAEPGRMGGLVGARVEAALERAKVTHRWEAVPPARQLQIIQSGRGYIAAIGWIATEQRRQMARFSDPVYQDGTFVGLVRQDEDRLRDGQSLGSVLADSRLTLLVKDAYSYGQDIDALIAQQRPRRVSTPADNSAMLRMLSEKRADYFLLSVEEAEALLARSSFGRHRLVSFAAAPRGVVRHLMFTRDVPDAVVQKFNDAMRELGSGSPAP